MEKDLLQTLALALERDHVQLGQQEQQAPQLLLLYPDLELVRGEREDLAPQLRQTGRLLRAGQTEKKGSPLVLPQG